MGLGNWEVVISHPGVASEQRRGAGYVEVIVSTERYATDVLIRPSIFAEDAHAEPKWPYDECTCESA